MIYNDVRENKDKGFSLVELIIVIAIMAVLVAVLAPTLLQYVERSRAQKDDSAMSEVANAIMLAMSDQDIYDEVLYYSCGDNFSCYIDETTKNATEANGTRGSASKISSGSGYTWDDNARKNDEKPYYASGSMRGVTITFHPNAKNTYKIADGVVNEFAAGSGKFDGKEARSLTTYGSGEAPEATALSDVTAGSGNYLYNRVLSTVGDSIKLSSQTYRNSNYTVFIRMGSTGGNSATAQDAISVYGQWGGTNLLSREKSPLEASGSGSGSGTDAGTGTGGTT